jgi:hypothetical protein
MTCLYFEMVDMRVYELFLEDSLASERYTLMGRDGLKDSKLFNSLVFADSSFLGLVLAFSDLLALGLGLVVIGYLIFNIGYFYK